MMADKPKKPGLFLVKKDDQSPIPEPQADTAPRNTARKKLAETFEEFKDNIAEVVILVVTPQGEFFYRCNVLPDRAHWLASIAAAQWVGSPVLMAQEDGTPTDAA
jgi:hypothetical protein